MEQFNPDMRLVAIDQGDLVVSFDSASAIDHGRAPKALRITRDFAQLSVAVAGFADSEHASLGDKKEFRGVVTLLVTQRDGAIVEHVLAEPVLWVTAESRNRKGGTFNFPAPEQVLLSVRQGMADALSRALAGYYAKESHMDTVTRAPAPVMIGAGGMVGGTVSEVRAAPQMAYSQQGTEPLYRGTVVAANDAADKKRLRTRLIIAAVATPLLVWGALAATVGTAGNQDPIKNAVAEAMHQDPRSVQAQVDLTKETLKQMGLDPGKAGDTGCLAPE